MIIIDVEASGVNYEKHSIVSIGALDFDNPTNRFYGECRVWEGAHIDEDALAVNGFTEDELKDNDKQSEADLVRAFTEWSQHMGDRTLTGQNVSFDRDMIKAATGRAGMSFGFAHRTLDTHTMCWMHMVERGMNAPIDEQHRRSALDLDAVLNYCGIPSEPEPHNALTGALCHAEVASRLLNNKKLLPEFSQFEIPWLDSSVTI
jgi:DNA polymerase III epsilon subunit-like protein